MCSCGPGYVLSFFLVLLFSTQRLDADRTRRKASTQDAGAEPGTTKAYSITQDMLDVDVVSHSPSHMLPVSGYAGC